jgi:probable rRNA maturation factor
MPVEVIIEDARWRGLKLDRLAALASGTTLSHLGHDPEACEVSLLACNDARIADLNGAFRDKPQPTNVLSWPTQDLAAKTPGGAPSAPQPDAFGDIALGDMALAWETCAREAQAAGLPMADHAAHLIVHGHLHLLGYDHERDADATVMERIEIEILGAMGIKNPYTLIDGRTRS